MSLADLVPFFAACHANGDTLSSSEWGERDGGKQIEESDRKRGQRHLQPGMRTTAGPAAAGVRVPAGRCRVWVDVDAGAENSSWLMLLLFSPSCVRAIRDSFSLSTAPRSTISGLRECSEQNLSSQLVYLLICLSKAAAYRSPM